MGSVYNRSKDRNNPNYYAQYKDADGTWKSVPTNMPTKEQAKMFLCKIEANISAGKVGLPRKEEKVLCSELMSQWMEGLVNRNAKDDRRRAIKDLLPYFGTMAIDAITTADVIKWLDLCRAKKVHVGATILHHMNLLSRFFTWAMDRNHAAINPVHRVPKHIRPKASQKRDVPYLKDDNLVRVIISKLPEPIDLMFYLGNQSGLRTGEIAGLRMADLAFLEQGTLRVRFSYEGPLKEDKESIGKMKWVPAANDAKAHLEAWLTKREAEGAGPESLVFPCANRDGKCYRREFLEGRWEKVAEALGLVLTWYEATRHSFASRSLEKGGSLDEVSRALGHSSPAVTKKYYDHFVRKEFSPMLREGLGKKAQPQNVVPLSSKKKSDTQPSVECDAQSSTDGKSSVG